MGDPANELIRLAEERNVDLIAMSTHGHRFFNDLLRGTTVSKVRHFVKIPVLCSHNAPPSIPTPTPISKLGIGVGNWSCSSLQPRLERTRQKLQHILFAHIVWPCAGLDRALFVDRARAARSTDTSDDVRLIGL